MATCWFVEEWVVAFDVDFVSAHGKFSSALEQS
jgi:hypothetical protein